jgi:hypothetical protein
VLRIADDRPSISAYHDMADPRWFFVPLTAASMMLITNGLVRNERHGHNATLGLLLLGVIMFDNQGDSAGPHLVFTVGFFVLGLVFTVLMVTHYVTVLAHRRRPSVILFVVNALVVGALLALAALLFEPSTFWLESVAVWIIALHFLTHAVWEVRRPHDRAEPPTVLHQLSPRLYRAFAWVLAPLTRTWRRLNRERHAAAQDLARRR